jgi:hypothetical protein
LRFITGGPESGAVAARLIGDAKSLDIGSFLAKPVPIQRLRDVLNEEMAYLEELQ